MPLCTLCSYHTQNVSTLSVSVTSSAIILRLHGEIVPGSEG